MLRTSRRLDLASLVVILLTLALFGIAVFVKGLTHDLLLESGVFLVSVKLILMSHKQGVSSARTEERLDRVETLLTQRLPPAAPP